MRILPLLLLATCAGVAMLAIQAAPATAGIASVAAGDQRPTYLGDRGPGLATSMFGTYIRKGEWLVYPFFEYYRDNNVEYKPAEMGYSLERDFRGKYRASEGILFVSYGITDRIAVEVEAAAITARQDKAANDPSSVPARIQESGSGDVEGQLHMRWAAESARRPEVFSYFEAVSPQQREKVLIGTPNWEFALGTGLTKGFGWGTMTVRTAADYSVEEGVLDFGESAVEYLKRLSPSWRVYLGVEGNQDELSGITELQWHVSDSMFLKLNNGFGLTSKATDWAPEVGVVFSFPSLQSAALHTLGWPTRTTPVLR